MAIHEKEIRLELISETTEMKQNLRYRKVDETLSEWELSRQTSKTWSMEQD